MPPLPTIPGPKLRELKSRAQLLEPVLKLGHAGVSDAFIHALKEALVQHGLVKIRFTDFKDEKKRLVLEIADRAQAHLVSRVGNVAVFYLPPPAFEMPSRETIHPT